MSMRQGLEDIYLSAEVLEQLLAESITVHGLDGDGDVSFLRTKA